MDQPPSTEEAATAGHPALQIRTRDATHYRHRHGLWYYRCARRSIR